MRAGRRLFSKAFFTTKTMSNIILFFTTRLTSVVQFNSEGKNGIQYFNYKNALKRTKNILKKLTTRRDAAAKKNSYIQEE